MEYLYRNPKKPVSKSFEILSAIQGFLAFVRKYEIKIEKTKKKPKNDMKCHYLKKISRYFNQSEPTSRATKQILRSAQGLLRLKVVIVSKEIKLKWKLSNNTPTFYFKIMLGIKIEFYLNTF